jgi:hypothetical protein
MMKKNRYLLCLLVCGFLLYYAVPRLSLATFGAEKTFSIAWLIFALMVIAGNLTGILYHPKKSNRETRILPKRNKKRSYY